MRKRIVVGFALLLLLFIGISIFGGSLFWHLIGMGTDLTISGTAPVVRPGAGVEATGWSHYGRNAGSSRYSGAAEITRGNVKRLEVAWTYRTGDLDSKPHVIGRSVFEATPILVEDLLIFCTPFNEVVALDPGTGAERWRYDPKIDLDQRPANMFVCRGVSHWRDTRVPADEPCADRIFTGTNDARIIALDARTGAPCADFGENGVVRIDPGMDLLWPGEFQITSPPTIIGDTVVVGSTISDNRRLEAPNGTVRAYTARTGSLRWTFDPIPRSQDDPARATWPGGNPPREGHANVWALMSVDEARGLIFLPTSSPSPDFYGGLRAGNNLYTDSVVALRGDTGKIVWHFQTVHHDVWDYDLPAQPGLYAVWKDGKARDVVAQVTKTGLVFVLDRDTGKPVDLAPLAPTLKLGTPNLGGPVITAGGLVFIGAAMDHYLRAFDVATGTELWKGRLPASGVATPMTYEWQGRQYVVIAAGGYSRLGLTASDHLVAFALPDTSPTEP